ncbi:MAG: vitamin K epoxide reductase family protein [Micrococcales bacterium]
MSTESISSERSYAPTKGLAWLMIGLGFLGWIAAFALTLERFHVAANPNDSLSCDLNIFISCKSVMLTAQAKLFGFPNPLIGLSAFVAPIIVGFGVLAGAKFAEWFWRMFMAGLSLGFLFVLWLSSQSIFVINVLCPYCIVAWAAMIPLFWHVLLWMLKEDIIHGPASWAGFFDAAYRRAWIFPLATELLLTTLVIIQFWSLWPTMF